MDMETKRVIVDGLRGADVATLQVLTQDVLSLPVNQVHPVTVCDLFALAEVSDQVPDQLARDLAGFVERCQRELGDLPDGAALDAYTSELKTVDSARVPETMRSCLQGLTAEADESVQEVVAALAAHFGETAALPFEVSDDASVALMVRLNRVTRWEWFILEALQVPHYVKAHRLWLLRSRLG